MLGRAILQSVDATNAELETIKMQGAVMEGYSEELTASACSTVSLLKKQSRAIEASNIIAAKTRDILKELVTTQREATAVLAQSVEHHGRVETIIRDTGLEQSKILSRLAENSAEEKTRRVHTEGVLKDIEVSVQAIPEGKHQGAEPKKTTKVDDKPKMIESLINPKERRRVYEELAEAKKPTGIRKSAEPSGTAAMQISASVPLATLHRRRHIRKDSESGESSDEDSKSLSKKRSTRALSVMQSKTSKKGRKSYEDYGCDLRRRLQLGEE